MYSKNLNPTCLFFEFLRAQRSSICKVFGERASPTQLQLRPMGRSSVCEDASKLQFRVMRK